MDFRKDRPLVLKGSTSALCNNLSVVVNEVKSVISYAVVHKSVVNLVTAATDGSSANHRQIICKEPSASHGNSMVLQARLVPMPNRTILVIASQKGIQMFEADGSVMLFWYALGDVAQGGAADAEDADISGAQSFGRGICGVMTDTIAVGTNEGSILLFDIPTRSSNITMSESLAGHKAAICDLEAERDKMVSSDERGNIIVWRCGDNFTQIVNIPGSGWPCLSLGLWKDTVVGGYGCGHIRVFSASTGNITAEVTAHAKWINAIDIAKESGLMLSGSEDSFVRVWQLKPGGEIELRHSQHVADIQLQGAKFISDSGRAFGCTGYDSNEINFFTMA